MPKDKISDKQTQILEYIKQAILTKGYPPTVREICQEVGLKSPASVQAHIDTLENLGYIRRNPNKNRAIEIMDDDFSLSRREVSNIPVVGRVAAGEPILADQNVLDYFPLPVEMLPNDPVFMLVVKGDSMIDAGIFSGDKVIVRQTDTARNGDMVVAMIDDGATVKYFYKENGHFRLQPDNPDYEPIITDHVEILGIVIGVFRMF